ncbi:MAG: S24 family peptidase [Erysipelotrichaceae bacterium]|nr:S24 family peptidase [Erysipelotrichaceae bacterium]
MSFQENLRYLRKQAHHSQQELADLLHYKSFTTIQKWEDGTSCPPYPIIKKIAELYHVPVEDIMDQDLQTHPVTIPILGTVRGGEPILAAQQFLGQEMVLEKEATNGEYFYLEVVGDSMKNARILPGDLLYVRKQDVLNNGEIGVVLVEEEATVKRVYFKENKMILQPENDDYQPIVLTAEDIEEKQVQIIGKVIHNKIRYE